MEWRAPFCLMQASTTTLHIHHLLWLDRYSQTLSLLLPSLFPRPSLPVHHLSCTQLNDDRTVETSAFVTYLRWLNSLSLSWLCYWVSQFNTIISVKDAIEFTVCSSGRNNVQMQPCVLHLPVHTALALECNHAFDSWLKAAFNSWLLLLNAGALGLYLRMHVHMFLTLQSLVSSCCTLARSRSEGWTLTTPTTTTSSPSLCLTSTMWPWWTMMLWSTGSTGQTSARRPSRGLSSMALELRLWSLLVRRRQQCGINTIHKAHCFQFVQTLLTKKQIGSNSFCSYGMSRHLWELGFLLQESTVHYREDFLLGHSRVCSLK